MVLGPGVVGLPSGPVAIHETRPYVGSPSCCVLPERLSRLRPGHPYPRPFNDVLIAAAEPSLAIDDLVEESGLFSACKGCEVPSPALNVPLSTRVECIRPRHANRWDIFIKVAVDGIENRQGATNEVAVIENTYFFRETSGEKTNYLYQRRHFVGCDSRVAGVGELARQHSVCSGEDNREPCLRGQQEPIDCHSIRLNHHRETSEYVV